jgi:hypothetical protein
MRAHPPDAVRVEAFAMSARGSGFAELLGKVRDNPSLLLTDPKRELRSFSVALTAPMGVKRGRGKGMFIDSVLDLIDTFYADVVQHLKAWSASPPKMRESVQVPEEEPQLVSTALSSQDGEEQTSNESGTEGAAAPDLNSAVRSAWQAKYTKTLELVAHYGTLASVPDFGVVGVTPTPFRAAGEPPHVAPM